MGARTHDEADINWKEGLRLQSQTMEGVSEDEFKLQGLYDEAVQ